MDAKAERDVHEFLLQALLAGLPNDDPYVRAAARVYSDADPAIGFTVGHAQKWTSCGVPVARSPACRPTPRGRS